MIPVLLLAAAVVADTNHFPALEERLNDIIIPAIEFREANPLDVVDFLTDATVPRPPIGIGFMTVLTNQEEVVETPDPRAEWVKDISPLTLELHRVTLLEAIDQITAKAGLKYEITNDVLLIRTKDGKILNKDK